MANNYANIDTQAMVDSLPVTMVLDGKTITGATIEHWATEGWREITSIAEPSEGCRVTGWNIVEDDGTHCHLTVAGEVNIATEQADWAAEHLANLKAYAKSQIVDRTEVREIVAAILETTFELIVPQINTLRAEHGLAAINQAQVITAIKTTFKDNYDGKIDSWI